MSETVGSPESQERARDYNVRQRESRAELHNELRSPVEKIFGRGKASEKSIAKEEATRMDEEIEQLLASGEAKDRSEAVNILNQREDSARGRVYNPSLEFDGGESMRYAGNYRVDGKSATPEDGEK